MQALTMLISFIIILMVATAALPSPEHFPKTNGGCFPLWLRFNDNCYRFLGEPMTWGEAELYCQRWDTKIGHLVSVGHLVSIHSKKENDFVNLMWQTTIIDPGLDEDLFEPDVNRANAMWIGLSDHEEEDHWHWTDNSTTHGYNNWRWYQPNNNDDLDGTGRGEDCAHMFKRSYPWHWWYGDWNDATCDRLLPFVCELPIDE